MGRQTMRKLLGAFTLLLALSGCSFLHIHKMDIEQGNVITPEMANKIHVGMSKDQVKEILGNPILVNVFDNNRIDYVYTYKPGYGQIDERYMTLLFSHGRLVHIRGNMYSEFINK